MFLRDLFFIFLLCFSASCQLPPALYVLNTPLAFSCSVDYNPALSDAEESATWLEQCPNTEDTWLRFAVYANKSDTSGFLFYQNPDPATPYSFFSDLVRDHIVNGIIVPNTEYIVDFLADDTCSSIDPGGIDRGQTFPSIYLRNPIKYSGDNSIKGLDNMVNRETSIIIPPLTCLNSGSFVVTTVDYINHAESRASNILVLN